MKHDSITGRFVGNDFWLYVIKTETCWLWTGKHHSGKWPYGQYYYKGKLRYAHRVSWELVCGDIPQGLCVLHHCDNPLCVNPAHLFLGNLEDNALDAVNKGRMFPVWNMKGEGSGNAKLTWKLVRSIRQRYASGETQAAIANSIGTDRSNVSCIVNMKTWIEK